MDNPARHDGRRRGGRLVVVALAALALLATACGGGGTDTAADDTAADGAGSAADIQQLAQGNEFCQRLGQVMVRVADPEFAGSDDPFGELAALFDELARNAPEEIRGDLTLWRDHMRRLGEAMASGRDPEFTDEDDQALEEADQRIQAYVEQNCGVDLSDEEASSSDTAGDSSQQATLTVHGEVPGEQQYQGPEVSCSVWPNDGTLHIELQPDDGWFAMIVSYYEALSTGTFDLFEMGSTLGPPDDTELGAQLADEGEVLYGASGTLTVTAVGEPHTTEDGDTLVHIEGHFTVDELYNNLDGSTVGSAEGTFRCEPFIVEG